MGCDIHAHTEIKINGRWHHFNALYISRSYTLFSRMANVRNYADSEIEPISDPRGLPADITFETNFDYNHMKEDAHSASWLSGTEVAALGEWYEAKRKEMNPEDSNFYSFEHQVVGYIFGNGWDIQKYPQDYPKGVEDARLIFWFDN